MKILFWIGRAGFFSSLIRVFKCHGISHCEIQFSDGACGTAYPGTGIVLRSLEVKPGDWYVIDVPCSLETESLVRQFFVAEMGCGYDIWGLVWAQVFGWNWQSKTKWFCSEACTAALVPAIPSLKSQVPCRVDPARLARLIEACPEMKTWNASPIG